MTQSLSTLSRLTVPDAGVFGPDAQETYYQKLLENPDLGGYALAQRGAATADRKARTMAYLEQLGQVNAMQRAMADREQARLARKDTMDFSGGLAKDAGMSAADAIALVTGIPLRDIGRTDAARLANTESGTMENVGQATNQLGQAGYFPEQEALAKRLGLPLTLGTPTGVSAAGAGNPGRDTVQTAQAPVVDGSNVPPATRTTITSVRPAATTPTAGSTPVPKGFTPDQIKSSARQPNGTFVLEFNVPTRLNTGQPVKRVTVDTSGRILAYE